MITATPSGNPSSEDCCGWLKWHVLIIIGGIILILCFMNKK